MWGVSSPDDLGDSHTPSVGLPGQQVDKVSSTNRQVLCHAAASLGNELVGRFEDDAPGWSLWRRLKLVTSALLDRLTTQASERPELVEFGQRPSKSSTDKRAREPTWVRQKRMVAEILRRVRQFRTADARSMGRWPSVPHVVERVAVIQQLHPEDDGADENDSLNECFGDLPPASDVGGSVMMTMS